MQKEPSSSHIGRMGLPQQIWAPFAQNRTPVVYEPGRMIYVQGTMATRFYYVVEGKAKAFISSVEGDERILRVFGPGDLMGEASFFDRLPRVSSAMAITYCKLIAIDEATLHQVFASHPELVTAMLQYLARMVRLLSGHVDDISFQRANKRLARFLYHLYTETGARIPTTQEEMGASIGASRVTVSRILAEFSRQGWLKIGYGMVEILQPELLRQFSEG